MAAGALDLIFEGASGDSEIRKFEGVGLTAVLAVSAAISGCGRGDDWQASAGPARVCVDNQGQRVHDQDCVTRPGEGSGTIHSWYYLSNAWVRGSGVPPVGGPVSGGSYVPTSGVHYGGVPAGGIARGGFGGTGEGGGEGHGGGE